MKNRRMYLIVAFIALSTLFFTSFVHNPFFAQQQPLGNSIEVSPPSQELTADPGTKTDVEALVRNKSAKPITLVARIEDFTASGDEGQVALIEKGPWAISEWSTVEPNTFSLKPGEEQKVIVHIDVPAQNTGGGRYGAVVFAREGKQAHNAAAVTQEIASLFLLRISGPINENIQITELKTPSFIEFGPVPMELSIKNVGNIHSKITGIITVTNVLGKKVADIVIPPTNVFPQASRLIPIVLDKKFLIGPYQALSIVYYGEENKSITSFTPFFVFPVRLIAGLIIVLLLLYFLRNRFSKAFKALVTKEK